MTKISFEENFEIYLFSSTDQTAGSSKLGEFLSFLKFHKVNPSYKFSFVAKEAGLIPEMTLNQNILIDFTPNSLTESKEMQFQEFLKDQNNRSLESLYRTILLPHELPGQSNAQMKKVCSLIKALLYEGQFIFLEEPEIDLEPEMLSLFISALKEHMADHQINVFIFSNNHSLWAPHSQKLVERRADYSFNITPIVHNLEWKEERRRFYAPAEAESSFESLKFHMPKEKSKKRTAA